MLLVDGLIIVRVSLEEAGDVHFDLLFLAYRVLVARRQKRMPCRAVVEGSGGKAAIESSALFSRRIGHAIRKSEDFPKPNL